MFGRSGCNLNIFNHKTRTISYAIVILCISYMVCILVIILEAA